MKVNLELHKEAMEYQVNHQGICWLLKVLRRAKLITAEEQKNSKIYMVNHLKYLGMYSNNATYPIKAIDAHHINAFLACHADRTLWSKRTKYGQTRIDTFKEIIKQINISRELANDVETCVVE